MESRDAVEVVTRVLREDGVWIFTQGRRLEVETDGQGIRVQERYGGTEREETMDRQLIAAGHTPNLKGHGIRESESSLFGPRGRNRCYFRTSNSRIYAWATFVPGIGLFMPPILCPGRSWPTLSSRGASATVDW